MAQANAPRVLLFKIESTETETTVVFEFGVKSVERPIPNGHGLVRGCAIFDAKGDLLDVELVTTKT